MHCKGQLLHTVLLHLKVEYEKLWQLINNIIKKIMIKQE